MKEQEITQNQTELTTKSVNPTLEVRGNIFMSEPGEKETPPKESTETQQLKPEVTMRDSLEKRQEATRTHFEKKNQGRTVPFEERQTQRLMIKQGVLPQAGGSGDEPETTNEENSSQKDKEQEEIIDTSGDFFSALEGLTDNASDQALRETVREKGERLINFLAEGLPRESLEKYLDSLRDLKDLSPREIKLRFGNIIGSIRNERKTADLEDPGVRQAREEHERSLSDELKRERESTNAPSEPEEAGGGDGGGKEPDKDKSNGDNELNNKGGEIKDEKLQDILRLFGGLRGDEDARENIINNIISNPDLQGIIMHVNRGDRSASIKSLSDLKAILENPDSDSAIKDAQAFLKNIDSKFTGDMVKIRSRMDSQEASERIDSVQALAKWIVTRQGEELWGDGGAYPLLDKGKLNQENFLIWLREQSIKLHEDTQNDEMYPLSSVGIETTYRNISIYMMTRFRGLFFKDEIDGKIMGKLADEVLSEAFGFGVIRNSHLLYRRVMRQDTELPKALVQLHARNDITRWNALETIYSMPASFGEKGDTGVGKGVQFANDIYYNLSDKEELIDVLGKDNLFTKDDFTNAIRIIQGKKDWEDIDDYGAHYDKNDSGGFFCLEMNGTKKYLFDEKGNIDMGTFVRLMNFYANPTERISTVNLVRELIRLKISQKHGLSAGVAFTDEEKEARRQKWEAVKEEDGEEEADRKFEAGRYADRVNLKFAETTSFEMQRPYGIAARNDVNRYGYDAATKLYLEDYLLRQSGENTAGPVGVPEAIGIFRMLSPDMWVGLRTESGQSPYEIFKELRAIENSAESKEKKEEKREKVLTKLRFRQDAELDYASNQEMRAFTIFHSMTGGEQLDLNKIVSYSFLEGVKYNPKEFEEQIKERFIKPMRYAFSSNAALKYSSVVRRLTNVREVGQGAVPVYEDVKLAEAMFSPEVLEGINPEDYDTYQGKVRMMKNASRSRIAAELRYHRKFGSVGETWNYHRTETFIDAIQTLEAYEKNPEHPGRVVKSGNRFFSKQDIDWIRKNSGSEVWKMLLIDSLREGAPALASGTWEGLIRFIQALAK